MEKQLNSVVRKLLFEERIFEPKEKRKGLLQMYVEWVLWADRAACAQALSGCAGGARRPRRLDAHRRGGR